MIDAWVDRSEVVIRYVEVELLNPVAARKTVLLPMNFLAINARKRQIRTRFITGAQFANWCRRCKEATTVTILEEEKIMAYYGGGSFYARPGRTEPLL